MTILESGARPFSLPNEADRFYWEWQGINNRPLQVFMFIHEWIGFTEQQKHDWLSFAQRNGEIVSSSILPLSNDGCEWTVVKKVDHRADLVVVASKEIRIQGLTEFFSTAVKKPS